MLLDSHELDANKHYINILFEDKSLKIGWDKNASFEDIRMNILISCDSLVDGDFVFLNDKAQEVNLRSFETIVPNATFYLKKLSDRVTDIGERGMRKIEVPISPLKHVESQAAIQNMTIGSNLLKHTKSGHPHIRNFQLSSDKKRIIWHTKSKSVADSSIAFDSINNIEIGQTSETFQNYSLPVLARFSFSIYYMRENKETTLDLTAKDEREFDLWMIGIKALFYEALGKKISKKNLLSHSRSFTSLLNEGKIGDSNKYLRYDEDSLNKNNLESMILSRKLSVKQLAELIKATCSNVQLRQKEVEEINEMQESNEGEAKEGYESVFNEEAIVDDMDSQRNQMIRLHKQCSQSLGTILQEFLWYCKEYKMSSFSSLEESEYDEFGIVLNSLENYQNVFYTGSTDFEPSKVSADQLLREIDVKLWKVEIDIENVADIVKRFKSKEEGFFSKVKGVFKFW